MSDKHFTHLHLHTDYSLLDGAISIDKLVQYGKENNRKALAISDHGNIFGAVKFFEKCKKAGIKPILGMEAYLTEDITVRNLNNKYYHLLLIVQNEEGYRNMCKLIGASYTDGFYFKPRIDYALLKKYSKGLIATTTCIGGHIPQLLINDKYNEAKNVLESMHDLFKENYYLEVQPPYLDKQATLNQYIFQLEKETNLPLIATGDCHYFSKEDRYAHEVMLAVQTRALMTDKNRMTFGDCRAHIQSIDELKSHFPEREDILWRTGEIADSCNFEFPSGKLFFPEFEIPKELEITPKKYFEKLSIEGFAKLCNENRIPKDLISVYEERLNSEIKMINEMNFETYFLIVSDFIKWSKRNNIAVGPGRGSVAGALVAWALEITDIDPIKYNLLFERFLNPERVSMPDIDIDFCINGREKVIQYVKNKYGHDKVGQIITFGTMAAKGVLKDVARALGFPFEDANAITDLIPDELKITLKDSLEQEPKLKEMCDKNPKVAELFDIASRLEGLTRHASKHAAGIVISPEPIADVLPIYVPSKSTDIVTQYAMTELESLGFLKMDFLGLKNLTLITDVLNLIKKNHNKDIDLTFLEMNDQKTFGLLCKGDTLGVFQFESSGIQEVFIKLQPTNFEDLIALNALYRPGPLGSGMIDDFIDGRHGRKKIIYTFPELEPILKDTYGVIVYQEQVMKIASVIAGYSLGESDILRRAMGKKKADVMAEQKSLFIERATQRGFDAKKSDDVFELMAYFAGYGFNKSHSAAYALIAYQTAYLKANYPIEFMSCLVSLELSNPDSSVLYLNQIKSHNIELLPPNINKSSSKFIPEGDNAVRFGLLGIKNLGSTACENILNEREKNGEFKNIFDFCLRVDLRLCNKRILENLIVSGTFDCFDSSRAEMIANLDIIIESAEILNERRRTGQMGLFDNNEESNDINLNYKDSWIKVSDWNLMQKLEKEKEILGIYLSQHPLDEYDLKLKKLGIKSIDNLLKSNIEKDKIITRGSLISFKEIMTKKGDRMAFSTLEDQNEKIELVIFPKIYAKYDNDLKHNSLILVSGSYVKEGSTPKIIVDSVFSLQNFSLKNIVKKIIFNFKGNSSNYDVSTILDFIQKKETHENAAEIVLKFQENGIKFEHFLNNNFKVNFDKLENNLNNIEVSIEI